VALLCSALVLRIHFILYNIKSQIYAVLVQYKYSQVEEVGTAREYAAIRNSQGVESHKETARE